MPNRHPLAVAVQSGNADVILGLQVDDLWGTLNTSAISRSGLTGRSSDRRPKSSASPRTTSTRRATIRTSSVSPKWTSPSRRTPRRRCLPDRSVQAADYRGSAPRDGRAGQEDRGRKRPEPGTRPHRGDVRRGTPARSAPRACRRRCGRRSRTRTGRSSAAAARVSGTSTSSIRRPAAAGRPPSGPGCRRPSAPRSRTRKHGRLCIGTQNDGDLMYAPGALWTAAHHRIPMLLVMHNNRAYHQEVMHLQRMANRRQRGITNAGIGTKIRIRTSTTRRSRAAWVSTRKGRSRIRRIWSGAQARRGARRTRRNGARRRGDATPLGAEGQARLMRDSRFC